MPGVQKKHLSTPEPTRHRARVHARERRRMLLDLKTSRRHATNGLFGVQNANGSSCSSPNVVRLRGQAQKTEYFKDILSVKVAPVIRAPIALPAPAARAASRAREGRDIVKPRPRQGIKTVISPARAPVALA
jgi:hypothetical protein